MNGDIEVLPCPFCGSSDLRTITGMNSINCEDCGASIWRMHGTMNEAVAAWNSRAGEDELLQKILLLQMIIDKME